MKNSNLKVKKNYLEKIKKFQTYNEAYYNKSDPIVDDAIYDSLKNEILQLEKTYTFLKSNDSPSTNIFENPYSDPRSFILKVAFECSLTPFLYFEISP